jgi:hypothetical protein
MKNILLYLFASAAMILGVTACWPVGNCEEYPGGYKYIFTIPAEIYPKQDTFDVGDTIWIDVQIPPEIEEDISGKTLPISKLNIRALHCDLGVYLFDSLGRGYFDNPITSFSYITLLGTTEIIGGGFTAHLKMNLDDVSKRSLIGVVPQKAGEYAIILSHTGGIETTTDYFDDNYCYSYAQLQYNVNGPDSNNYYIMEKYGPERVGSYETHKQSGKYAFVVK